MCHLYGSRWCNSLVIQFCTNHKVPLTAHVMSTFCCDEDKSATLSLSQRDVTSRSDPHYPLTTPTLPWLRLHWTDRYWTGTHAPPFKGTTKGHKPPTLITITVGPVPICKKNGTELIKSGLEVVQNQYLDQLYFKKWSILVSLEEKTSYLPLASIHITIKEQSLHR